MAESDFKRQQRAAVERMREMNSRSQFKTQNARPSSQNSVKKDSPQNNRASSPQNNTPPPKPKNNSGSAQSQNNNGFLNLGLNIPFLDDLTKDGDSALLVGLLLILMNEKSDKTLLFALAYILL